jgi:hypothetical protein
MEMNNSYKELLASQVQRVEKSEDYSRLMVAELQSNMILDYQQDQTAFVADRWVPMAPMKAIAGLIGRMNKENKFTPRAATWRPGTMPATGSVKVDNPITFACQRYAFQSNLTDDIPYVADEVYNIEVATTRLVSDVLQLNKELIIKDALFKAGVWGIDLTGVNSGETWSPGEVTTGETFRRLNDSDSDPLNLFKDLTLAIKQKIGVKPNTLLMGEQVYEALRLNPTLISLYRNPQGSEKVPTKLNEQMIAQALDVEKIIVAGAMYNKAQPGATVDLDWIFGKSMWYGFVDQPGMYKTFAAMNVSFNEPLGGFDTALVTVPDLLTHAEYYQGFQCFQPIVMEPYAGAFLLNSIA